jgi:murein DD-endopeptidase MepM/ murein hydrolase activator NlpD
MNAIIEAFFICIIASIIWAPIVFLIAARFSKRDTSGLTDKLWPLALVAAALPAILAPFAAAAGLSLRQSAPLPPMQAFEAPVNFAPVAAIEPAAASAPPLDLAAVLEASAILYFYGFVMFLGLGVIRMIWFSYRAQYAFNIDEPQLEAGLEDWRRRMGIKRRPRYAFSDTISSVCVHGFFRPVILMPMTLLDRVPVKDAILMGAHEMAHIKRGDTVLFALCTGVKAIFWFNPFMQRIAARANLAAEQAADALVIAHGAERRQYAHCFVQGLRFASGAPSSLSQELVPSFTPFDKRSRRERLDAILSKTGATPMLNLRHKAGLALSIITAAGLAFAQAALAVAPKPAREALPTTPVEGKITLSFGQRSVLLGDDRPTHEGVDIKAKRGSLVRASGAGKVIDATSRYRGKSAWGNVVVIDHGHGLVTRYAHLDSFTVKKGDTVDTGDVIGAVGSTGKSTGPHLHFEVIQDGLAIDPAPVLAAEPMAAPAPVIAPKPVKKSARAIVIAPAAAIAGLQQPEPNPAPEPRIAPAPRSEWIEQELAGRFKFVEGHLADTLENFDFNKFENFEFDFDNSAFDGFNGFEAFSVSEFGDVQRWGWLSQEERENVIEARRNATEIARDALREAKAGIAQAQRDNKRAQRDQKRARRDMERTRRSAERTWPDAESTRLDAERTKLDVEREMKRVKRGWAKSNDNIDAQEILALQEKALKEAQINLENELAEIKRRRAELKREKRNTKTKNK